jgi:hypothetical protein
MRKKSVRDTNLSLNMFQKQIITISIVVALSIVVNSLVVNPHHGGGHGGFGQQDGHVFKAREEEERRMQTNRMEQALAQQAERANAMEQREHMGTEHRHEIEQRHVKNLEQHVQRELRDHDLAARAQVEHGARKSWPCDGTAASYEKGCQYVVLTGAAECELDVAVALLDGVDKLAVPDSEWMLWESLAMEQLRTGADPIEWRRASVARANANGDATAVCELERSFLYRPREMYAMRSMLRPAVNVKFVVVLSDPVARYWRQAYRLLDTHGAPAEKTNAVEVVESMLRYEVDWIARHGPPETTHEWDEMVLRCGSNEGDELGEGGAATLSSRYRANDEMRCAVLQSIYWMQVKRLQEHFGSANVLVVSQEALLLEPQTQVPRILEFIDAEHLHYASDERRDLNTIAQRRAVAANPFEGQRQRHIPPVPNSHIIRGALRDYLLPHVQQLIKLVHDPELVRHWPFYSDLVH